MDAEVLVRREPVQVCCWREVERRLCVGARQKLLQEFRISYHSKATCRYSNVTYIDKTIRRKVFRHQLWTDCIACSSPSVNTTDIHMEIIAIIAALAFFSRKSNAGAPKTRVVGKGSVSAGDQMARRWTDSGTKKPTVADGVINAPIF